MPFMGFKNFADCVKKQKAKGKSDLSARKICGSLQKKAEGSKLTDEEEKILEQEKIESWIEQVL